MTEGTVVARKPKGRVERGWAQKAGLLALSPNGTALEHKDVLSRLLIHETISRWGLAYDEGDMDVIRSLFVENGLFELFLGSAVPFARVSGREQIIDHLTFVMAEQNDQRRHLMGNVVINRMSADEASLSALALVSTAHEEVSLAVSTAYHVDLRRERDGVWRFTRFAILADHYTGRVPGSEPDE